MKPIIEFQHVSKKFKIGATQQPYLSIRDAITKWLDFKKSNTTEFYALNDVSFNVEQGDTLGIIGKNGAGKSTLLKVLSKITPPTSGQIITRGRIASLLEVGTGFHPELTGRDNVFMNGSILGMRKKEIGKNFDAIVDFAGIEKFIDTPLKHYSSGMQLRLAFAVAAFLENEILVIDEVLAVGDAEFQKKCLGKMDDVSKSGRTILFVSHQLTALRELCDKAILLNAGTVQMQATSDKVIEQYIQQIQGNNEIRNLEQKDQAIYLSDLNIYGNANQTKNAILPYQDCYFELTIQSSEDFEGIQIGIGIDDKMNNRITTCFTKHLGLSFKIKKGLNKISCRIKQLPLKPDIYQIHIYIGSSFEVLDYRENLYQMEVLPVDYFYKETPDDSQGSVIIDQEWSTL
jgi:lipopolysaccharide transport system ATP-binding protein